LHLRSFNRIQFGLPRLFASDILPIVIVARTAPKFRKGVFISYSHRDKRWFDTIYRSFIPVLRKEEVHPWSDREIERGGNWHNAITSALDEARAAVLLVTPNFLASDYVVKEELPRILANCRRRALIVFWIAVSASAYRATPLRKLQAANSPEEPLDMLRAGRRNQVLSDLAEKLANDLTTSALGNALKVADKSFVESKALKAGRRPPKSVRGLRVMARQEGTDIRFMEGKKEIEKITASEIQTLDAKSKTLIRSHEAAMEKLMERREVLYPQLYSENARVRESARKSLDVLRKQLAGELGYITDFLGVMGKRLHDHYLDVRFALEQPLPK
jgi:hypothetical protein